MEQIRLNEHPVIGFGDHLVCDSAARRARVAAGQSTDDIMDCHLVSDTSSTESAVLGTASATLVSGVIGALVGSAVAKAPIAGALIGGTIGGVATGVYFANFRWGNIWAPDQPQKPSK